MLGIETSLFKDFPLFGWGKGDAERGKTEARLEPRLGEPAAQQNAAAPAVDVQLSNAAKAASKSAADDLLMLPAPDERPNVRSMTPRELADFAYNMYMDGTLSWDEYRMVGFPSELHPDYDRTIGQLTGETAQPDRPKDMVSAWQQRVEFEERHSADKPDVIERARRVLDVLRWQDAPPDPVKLEV
jgi:hypothetical protein